MPYSEPKKILCIHSMAGAGRCSTALIQPVLAVMGCQPVMVPTVALSTHTGGLGEPARLDCTDLGLDSLAHYARLGLQFDCIYSGYLGSPAQAALVQRAFGLWPGAYKIVDPVMGDNGKVYASITPALAETLRALCRQADLILPNLTEACLLLNEPFPEAAPDAAAVQTLAQRLTALAPEVLVTGLPLDDAVGCAGGGREQFLHKQKRLPRSFHGTGDLFGAVLTGALMQGMALSAAADLAAGFVARAIRNTHPDADERLGVWFEPLLGQLAK